MPQELTLPPDPVIAELQAGLGRHLRVLHIGNIANNAYNNARIQRQYGIEADVICYDYYHVMSCPEWEDGSFTGPAEGNFPDWFSTSLKGFSRPQWFVQGPANLCLQYLRAAHLKMPFTQWLLREYLSVNYYRILDDFAALEGRKRPPISRRMRCIAWLVETIGLHDPIDHDSARLQALLHEGSGEKELADHSYVSVKPHTLWDRGRDHLKQIAAEARIGLFDRLVLAPMSESRFDAGGVRIWMLLRRARGHAYQSPQDMASFLQQELAKGSRESRNDFEARVSENRKLRQQKLQKRLKSGVKLIYLPLKAARWMKQVLRALVKRLVRRLFKQITVKISSIITPKERAARDALFLARRQQLLNDATMSQAESAVQDEVRIYADNHPLRFFDVMAHYDVVQGYSIDGFIPYMNGLSRFAAYEHGTIRDLPWEPSLSGIVCARVYREAPLVFVTNSDVLPSVDRLGLAPERVVYLPHAFDDAKLRAFRDANPDLQPPEGPAVFFSPTRHHWKDKSGSWTKGNDIFLRAAGELLKEGHDFRLILVEWGKEVPDSRELIDSLGLTSRVTWVPTMQKRELWVEYCRSHAVVDQFTLPALGGVGFETMALGRRLITALDEAQMTRFFGCPPPCLIAQSVEACRDRLREVVLDPHDTAGRGSAARQWMIDYHSAQRIVSLQAQAYRTLLASAPAEPWRS
jgi:glycosyltransferase involved in cell wall biosynthesis